MSEIEKRLMSCFDSLPNWQSVLAQLSVETGCRKALVSLRDLDTCRIIIPKHLPTSPFQYEFAEEYVESYISEYCVHDAWCEVQAAKFPYKPLWMSRHLDVDELKQTKFWEWLAPQDIEEAVVVSLGEKYGGWIALNLYFGRGDEPNRSSINELINSQLELMKRVMALGFAFHELLVDRNQLKLIANSQSRVRAIAKQDGSVLLGTWPNQIPFQPIKEPDIQYEVVKVASQQTHLGESIDYLVLLNPVGRLSKELTICRAELYGPQPTILTVLHQGGTLKDCVSETGMALNTVKYHWAKLQGRFGLSHPRELQGVEITYV